MNNLFKSRRQKHFILLLKYWRLVFNDHFVIALFFMFGALAYGYSQWLPTVSQGSLWVKCLLVIFMTVISQLGRLATLTKSPDPIFLLPQTDSMKGYFKGSITYSMILGILISCCGVVVALPLSLVNEKLGVMEVLALFATAGLLKAAWLLRRYQHSRMDDQSVMLDRWLLWGVPLVTWLVNWFINPLLATVIALIVLICEVVLLRKKSRLNWRVIIKRENDRMASIYRFFNLFTDVPMVQGNVKRRSYLNCIISWLDDGSSFWSSLYARGFIRDGEISGLVMRLTVIFMLVAFFVPNMILNAVIVALGMYLIAAQIIPLFDQYQNNVFVHVYPVNSNVQEKVFARIMKKILTCVAVLLSISSLGMRLSLVQLLISVVICGIEVFLLTGPYLKYRIKKL